MDSKIRWQKVPPEALRWRADLDWLPFETTEQIEATHEIIGQERALHAIRLGLEMDGIGYNIFVTGLSGTGRTTTIKSLLERMDTRGRIPNDICYVNNFRNPDNPRVLVLPAGVGSKLKRSMEELVANLKRTIPAVFENEEFRRRSNAIVQEVDEKTREIIREFERRVNREGFALIQVQLGPVVRPDITPVIGGQPVSLDDLEALVESGRFPRDEYERLRNRRLELAAELDAVGQAVKAARKELPERLEALQKEFVAPALRDLIGDIKDAFPYPKVHEYLDEVQGSILHNLERFREAAAAPGEREAAAEALGFKTQQSDELIEYSVNVVVDNADADRAPIIIENFPTYRNIFGTIERMVDRLGRWRTDFTRIKAGSLLKANGGFLVLNALDALVEPGVYTALKRTLKSRCFEPQTYDPFYFFGGTGLKPEAIEINVKVVMIGDAYLYNLLYALDEDFRKIFKINAPFDSEMDKERDGLRDYVAVLSKIIKEESLLPFDKSGIGAVLEFAVRHAGRKKKISTRFADVADVLREASYWAKKAGSSLVKGEHVDKAIEEKIFRSRMLEDKIHEWIADGLILVDTDGKKVGVVNGLSVYDMGFYSFGRPARITAQVSLGRAGIINIEREAALSGKIHDKGVYILSGYLRGKYAHDKPLSISASICFEQSYTGVEGDSASSTELYALLSALSGLPLRQDIAVTGSVNQKGEIQPVGGVNQKIEGFFEVCRAKGLTGTQGVIIPHQNVGDLMLRKEVIRAVEEGKFHIYAVHTVDEGIEILTGVPAGERQPDGSYPPGTVNYMVEQRLREMAERLREIETAGAEKSSS